MNTKKTADDPNGLIHEAFRIDGITAPECRTIFLDWALSLPAGADRAGAAERLLALHGMPGHPMSAMLAEAVAAPAVPVRRGGRRARLGDAG